MRKFILLALVALLPGCATVVSGTSQTLTVLSDPTGATCQLQRDGAVVGAVATTPGTVQVGKSTRDLVVQCQKPGYIAGTQSLPAEFQAATLGNVLLGGVVGLVVDASSGAMSSYPATVNVVLTPERFASEDDRTRFVAARAADVRREAAERAAAIRRDCPPGNTAPCDARVERVEAERDARPAALEGRTTGVR